MRYAAILMTATIMLSSSYAEKIAIFPALGVNTDQSFVDAFGMLLANKYSKVSGAEVLSPVKSGRALGEDSSLVTAAQKLGVSEYLEIEAVGLYLSRKEKIALPLATTSENGKQTIVVKIDNDDNDDNDDDQELLDNHKTVVKVTRRDSRGDRIFAAEMTLVTYGDIEESTDRFAHALFQKVAPEEVRGLKNVTRREGMGNNKLFIDKLKGIRIGFWHPMAKEVSLQNMVTIAYSQRFDSETFYLEFGAGAKIPTSMKADKRYYGGPYMDINGSYYFLKGVTGVYAGIGVSPYVNVAADEGVEIGVPPYIQFGMAIPRNGKMQGIVNVKILQNVMEISTGDSPNGYSSSSDLPLKHSYPTEVGIEFGIAF